MLCFSLQMRLDGEILISANGRLAVCRFYAWIMLGSCSDHGRIMLGSCSGSNRPSFGGSI